MFLAAAWTLTYFSIRGEDEIVLEYKLCCKLMLKRPKFLLFCDNRNWTSLHDWQRRWRVFFSVSSPTIEWCLENRLSCLGTWDYCGCLTESMPIQCRLHQLMSGESIILSCIVSCETALWLTSGKRFLCSCMSIFFSAVKVATVACWIMRFRQK